MPENCPPEPDKPILPGLPSDDQNINAPVGAQIPQLPVNPPAVAPGPVDPGEILDTTPPAYDQFRPRQDPATFQEFCSTIPTFRLINGIIMTILSNHFAVAANIIDPTLRQYTWHPDIEQTKMVINIQENWDPNIIGRKPAVYISRGDVNIPKLVIGDRKQEGRLDGAIEYFTVFEGSHNVRVYGAQGAPSDALAFEIATLLLRVSRWVVTEIKLLKFRPLQVSKKDRDDRDPEDSYFASIPMEWAFEYRWLTKFSAPKINFLDINAFRG
jgi:hypothetical protein